MTFDEAIQFLREAREKGHTLSFHSGGHWAMGVTEWFFWWEYHCCEAEDCVAGTFDEYKTADELSADNREFHHDDEWR